MVAELLGMPQPSPITTTTRTPLITCKSRISASTGSEAHAQHEPLEASGIDGARWKGGRSSAIDSLPASSEQELVPESRKGFLALKDPQTLSMDVSIPLVANKRPKLTAASASFIAPRVVNDSCGGTKSESVGRDDNSGSAAGRCGPR